MFEFHWTNLPILNLKDRLDTNLLKFLWWLQYKNHCKFLMLVRACNNHAKSQWVKLKNRAYYYLTMKQIWDIIWCHENTVNNIVKYCNEKWYIKTLINQNYAYCNHTNLYLYNINDSVEKEQNIDLKHIDVWPEEIVKKKIEESEIYTPSVWKFEWDKISTNEARVFYERIRDEWTKLEVTNCKEVFSIWRKQWFFDICCHQEDMYFCWWVDPKITKRCKDKDILAKKYFWVDIDIRKTIKDRTWEIISDNQLYWYIDEILNILDKSDFADYDEVVMSWNGVHIYYIWKSKQFTPELYKAWVSRIFMDIDELIAPLWLSTDKAVCNISSLFRCPATANYWRMSKYALDFWQAFVYKRQEWWGWTFDSIEAIWEQVMFERKLLEEKQKQIQLEIIKNSPKKDGGIFEKINSIPVSWIFTSYTWIELQPDGKNFKSTKDWKNIGCFYNKEKNILVNSWTHYLSANKNAYNSFDFVMREVLWLSNNKDNIKITIEYFKNNYWV